MTGKNLVSFSPVLAPYSNGLYFRVRFVFDLTGDGVAFSTFIVIIKSLVVIEGSDSSKLVLLANLRVDLSVFKF